MTLLEEAPVAAVPSPSVAPAPVPALAPRPPAARITTDAQALEVAAELAARFAPGAAARDAERRLPFAEVDAYAQSGLWAILVPRAFGGPDLSRVTLAKVFQLISAADPSLGQIPQNHHFLVEILRWAGTPEQQTLFFGAALRGARFGNALAELDGSRYEQQTRLVARGDRFVLDGQKFYSTGVLFADWVVPSAKMESGERALVFVPRDAAGLTLVDDWSGFGQRTTASGTTLFAQVEVDAVSIVRHPPPSGLTLANPVAHLMHAAIQAGIASAAIADTIRFVRDQARSWTQGEPATADPYSLGKIGELQARLHAVEALLERAGRFLDEATADITEQRMGEAAVAVSEAKVLAVELALEASSVLVELGGARSTFAEHGFDRHWRNARTHSVHDPVRWKYHEIGNFWLNGVLPPLASGRSKAPAAPAS